MSQTVQCRGEAPPSIAGVTASPPPPVSFLVTNHASRALRPHGKATQADSKSTFCGSWQPLDSRACVSSEDLAAQLWSSSDGALDIFSSPCLNSPPSEGGMFAVLYIRRQYVNQCGGLNRHGPHRLVCLNVWPKRSGITRRHDLAGGSVSP